MSEKKWVKFPGLAKGFSTYTIIACFLFLALVFGAGMRVGIMYERGVHASEIKAQAKEEVKEAKQETKAVTAETVLSRPFYEYKTERATVFATANAEIDRMYPANKQDKSRPQKSVTTDVSPSKTELSHAQTECPAAAGADDQLFDAAELRLYNLGNKKADFTVRPEAVHGQVPRGPAGREGRLEAGSAAESQSGSSAVSRLRQLA